MTPNPVNPDNLENPENPVNPEKSPIWKKMEKPEIKKSRKSGNQKIWTEKTENLEN